MSQKLLNAVREAVRVVKDKWREIAPEDYGSLEQRLRAVAVMERSGEMYLKVGGIQLASARGVLGSGTPFNYMIEVRDRRIFLKPGSGVAVGRTGDEYRATQYFTPNIVRSKMIVGRGISPVVSRVQGVFYATTEGPLVFLETGRNETEIVSKGSSVVTGSDLERLLE
ncbi:hypothetical protein DRN62_01925 [Nanoarchaeota archaeon]|nr:MAG: hypothetical protein DRN62_01925 [Nanoarchaeota archaeon]